MDCDVSASNGHAASRRRHACVNSGLCWTTRPADGIRVERSLFNRRIRMKLFFLKIFTWWNGQTFGTQLWTWRFGELVGEDEQGNRYFRTKGGTIDPTLGFQRRWVVYNGYAEATRIPPAWHGWLHHTVDVAPTEESYTPREWEKPHRPNMTGTPAAYRPPALRWQAAAAPRPPAITTRGRRAATELAHCHSGRNPESCPTTAGFRARTSCAH